jgi:PAS domain S-box-containing protein
MYEIIARIKGRISLLVSTLLLITLVSIALSNYLLYRIALHQEGDLLIYTARNYAHFVEYFHHLEEKNLKREERLPIEKFLERYRMIPGSAATFGETGEFIIARREGDTIHFLVFNGLEKGGLPVNIPHESSRADIPIEWALTGKSGVAITEDYRGITVLAGYEPVQSVGLAIVVKKNIAEIRRPYIVSAAELFGIFAILILLGTRIFMKLFTPLIPALRESEEQMRLIADALPMLVAKLDRQWRYRFMNRAYEEWFGVKGDEYLGKHLWDLIGREAFEKVRPFTERAMAGETLTTENELPYSLGGRRHVEVVFMPSRSHTTGEVDGYLGIVTDITERRRMELALKSTNEMLEQKVQERTVELQRLNEILERELAWRVQAEKTLRESEERYRTLYEVSPDGVLLVDSDTALPIHFNDTAARQLGYTREEFAWLRISDYEAVERLEETRTHIENILRNGYDRFETRHRTKSGEIRNVDVSVRDIPLEGRRALYCIFHDITERKRIEARLHAFVNGLNESALLIDSLGNVLMINETGARRFGTNPDAMIGKCIFDYMPPEISRTRREFVRRVFENGKDVHFEDERSNRFYSHSLFPVKDASGDISSVAIIAFDNTDMILARNDLHKAKIEAENATKLKDKFVMLVSHDLKNPVVGILSMLQLMQKYPGSIVENKPFIDVAVDSCQKMLHMIEELLDISRIREGKLRLPLRFNDGAEIVRRAVALVTDLADRKWIAIHNRIPNGTYVFADPVFLQQVFYNLLTNAVKFSREGGTVTITQSVGENLIFTVEDRGIGIRPEIKQRIFDYNEKTSLPGTAGETGAGFGLPLSNDIIKAHNGSLEVETAPEGGTQFHIILPVPNPKLMILETCEGLKGSLKESLREKGFSLTIYSHPESMMESLKRGEECDLLLIQLSDEYGICADLIGKVGKVEQMKRLPVLTIGYCSCMDAWVNGIRFEEDSAPENVIEGIYSALLASTRAS